LLQDWAGGGVADQIFYAGDEFLRLKGFADEFIGLDGNGAIGNAFVDHAGHQDHRRFRELGILFHLAADGIAILVGHDHVGDDHVWHVLLKLREGGSGVGAGDDVDIFAAESNLDDLAHGGAVVNKINRGNLFGFRFTRLG
jgi:hypothetical protein